MIGPLKSIPVRQTKPAIAAYDSWRKGWNTLLRETEIDKEEMVTSTNLLLVGAGAPTLRWGSILAFQAGASNASLSGTTRFVLPVKDVNDNRQVLAWTDAGYLTKQNGASYTTITGASWLSGYPMEGTELGGKVYLVNGQRPLVRYDFSTLTSFVTISSPTGLTATNLSLATGTSSFSWKVTALSPVGETLPSTAVSLATLPQNLSTTVRLNWTAVTPGAGATLVGYNVYRGLAGNETWIAGVGPTVTRFDDSIGYPSLGGDQVPTIDTTGGPIAKWVLRFQDRLVLAGIPGEPTKILISAPYPQQERFDFFGGGGFLEVDPDSGEDITGIGIYYRTITATQTIVVFKERSVWEVVLDTLTVGNFAVLNPTYRLLTASQGATSHRSITPVENDIYFCNRRGVYILRYEPNLYNVISASELSAKIRPFFQNLSYTDISSAAGFYADKKYVLCFPETKQAIVFDRERLCFTGPWLFPWSLNHWGSYIDTTSGFEYWLAASGTDNNVYQFSTNYSNDAGQVIQTQFKTRKETFGDWTLFKTIQEVFVNFSNIIGQLQINIYIENRSGSVIAAKSKTITGASTGGTSGMGIDQFGLAQLGTSLFTPSNTGTGEMQKKAYIYQSGRTVQIEVVTTTNNANYQFLNSKVVAIPQSRGNSPSSWVL